MNELELVDRIYTYFPFTSLIPRRNIYHPHPPPLGQGWLQVRPGGAGAGPVAVRSGGELRCWGCGDDLCPVAPIEAEAQVGL